MALCTGSRKSTEEDKKALRQALKRQLSWWKGYTGLCQAQRNYTQGRGGRNVQSLCAVCVSVNVCVI